MNQPYGMEGGEPGQRGTNYWAQRNGDGSYTWLNIGPRGQIDMDPGDRFVVHTPGGGAWGKAGDGDSIATEKKNVDFQPRANGSLNAFLAAQLEA